MNRKNAFFFCFFLLWGYQSIAQNTKPVQSLHIGNRYKKEKLFLNPADARPILCHKYDDFYIAELKDNRVDKTNLIGKVRGNVFLNIALEGDSSITSVMQSLLSSCVSSTVTQTPVYASLNTLTIGESGDPYIILDLDFYKKDEKGTLVFLSNYRKIYNQPYSNFMNTGYAKLIYNGFREALNSINLQKKMYKK